MNKWLIFGLAIGVMVLQSTLVQALEISGVTPDLRLIFLVYIALKEGPATGATVGFFTGILSDVYDYDYLGANALAGTIIGYLAGFANEHVIELDRISKSFFMVFAFFIYDFLFALSLQSRGLVLFDYLTSESVPTGLYTMIIAIFFIFIQDKQRVDES